MLTVLAACATAPPVQEMSDARQAIAAAREAGAGELAPGGLAEAEALLTGAEGYLEVGTSAAYWQAKKAAISAKEIALSALLKSRSTQEAPGRNR
ncbi:MAG: hypothetical protein ACE5G3_08315 [Gammaproteobacteria bacterium]